MASQNSVLNSCITLCVHVSVCVGLCDFNTRLNKCVSVRLLEMFRKNVKVYDNR